MCPFPRKWLIIILLNNLSCRDMLNVPAQPYSKEYWRSSFRSLTLWNIFEHVHECWWLQLPEQYARQLGLSSQISQKRKHHTVFISRIYSMVQSPCWLPWSLQKGSGVTVGSFPPPARWGSLDFKKSVTPPPPSSPRLLSCLLLLCQLFAEPPIASSGRCGLARTERMPDRMSDRMSKYMLEIMSNRMS